VDYGFGETVALVTGASRGIGRAIAGVLAREGAAVAMAARSEELLGEGAAAIREHGGRAAALPCDLSNPASAGELTSRVRSALGADPTVVVINHATDSPPAKLHTMEMAELRKVLTTDLESSTAIVQAAIPHMMKQRYGRIVFVTSVAATQGLVAAPAYCAVKAALEGLARSLATDLSRYGITSNAVAPGVIDTPRPEGRDEGDVRERIKRTIAARRFGEAQEVAEVVAFLCSRAASYVSGSVVLVTGGGHLVSVGG